MARVVNVGLVGYGVVGKATVDTLIKNREIIYKKSGVDINVLGIADLTITDITDENLDKVQIKTKDFMDLVKNPDIDIIVELMGGTGVAKTLHLEAMNHKKHIVTANKALLATHGKELFTKSLENNVELAFEASVGGGIPILKVLKEDLAANNIYQLEGIINGTANYILTNMQNEGRGYEEVLKDAQKLGYAEADPTFDVKGIDTAHKLALLASIIFGSWVDINKVYVEGITEISAVDIDFAKELDCSIKLLAIAKNTADGLEVRVHPTIIPNHYQLSTVNDVYNAVQILGDKVGRVLFCGKGAGGNPTSSAVAADVLNVSKHILNNSVNVTPPLGFAGEIKDATNIIPIDEISSAFYIRVTMLDTPGVFAEVTSILAKHNISIRSALQRHRKDTDAHIPVIFLTHIAKSKDVMNAIKAIEALEHTAEKASCIRVEGVER